MLVWRGVAHVIEMGITYHPINMIAVVEKIIKFMQFCAYLILFHVHLKSTLPLHHCL